MTYRARPGDVYLLCSDGLTTMLREERIARSSLAARTASTTAVEPGARGQRGGRAGQHHGRRLPARGGRRCRGRGRGAARPGRPGGRGGRPDRRVRGRGAAEPRRADREALGRASRPAAPPPRASCSAARHRRLARSLAAVASWPCRRQRPPYGACARSTSSAATPAAGWPSTAAFPTTCRSTSSSTRSSTPPRSRSASIPAGSAGQRHQPHAALPRPTRSPWSRTSSGPPSPPVRQAEAADSQSHKQGRAAGRAVGSRARRSKNAVEVAGRRGSAAEGRAVSARNRELLALIPVALLVTAGFTAVFIVESSQIGDLSLIYGGYFLAVCLGVHLFIRARLPYADPYLFPLCALLAAIGLVMLFRINDTPGPEAGVDLRRRRGPACGDDPLRSRLPRARALPLPDRDGGHPAAAGAAPARDRRAGERRLPRASTSGRSRSSRPSSRRSASSSSSPATCTRSGSCSTVAARRVAGLHDPAAEALRAAARGLGRVDGDALLHPRPRQLADVLRRLPGAALRRHGTPLLRRRRAGRCSSSAPGVMQHAIAHVGDRVDIWLDPWRQQGASARARSSSRSSPRPTAGCSAQGLGESLLKLPGPFAPHCTQPFPDCGSILPAPHTDEIYAVIVSELGLFGGVGAGRRLRADRRPRLQDRRDGAATASRSSWPRA